MASWLRLPMPTRARATRRISKAGRACQERSGGSVGLQAGGPGEREIGRDLAPDQGVEFVRRERKRLDSLRDQLRLDLWVLEDFRDLAMQARDDRLRRLRRCE